MSDPGASMRPVLKAAGASSTAAVVSALAGAVRVKVYAVFLGPAGVGIASQVQTVTNTLQVLASLGFTGDSTGPHLHFHVADAAAPLLAEGLPFEFDRFKVLGRFDDLGDFGNSRWLGSGVVGLRQRERPAPNTVVNFDSE